MKTIVLLLLALLMSACAISPVERGTCQFTRYTLDVPTPGDAVGVAFASPRASAYGEAVGRALTSRPRALAGPASGGDLLFLSGGSQNGAFGAGYLAGWKANAPGGRLPDFDVVTGISTGAILSAFAFIDRPDIPEKAYAIRSERELITPLVSVRGGQPTASGYPRLIRKGAIADLAPLRENLPRVISPDVLLKVSARADQGRLLLVGVVDVDTGAAETLDLGDMAQRAVAAATPADRERLRDCYVEAVVASSSAPLAALPVFIDSRMYIDGGARFGAFSDEIGGIIDRAGPQMLAAKPVIHPLVSGDQRTLSRCGRKDAADCLPPGDRKGADPPQVPTGERAPWKFLDLTPRSKSILANQVCRFSADSIAYVAARREIPFDYVQIEPDAAGFRFELDDDALGKGA